MTSNDLEWPPMTSNDFPSRCCWASWDQVGQPWTSPRHSDWRVRGGVWRPAFPHPPPGTIQSQVRWTPGGKERPAEDGGGGDCHHNLLPPQIFVSVCSPKSVKTSVGEIRSDWTWSSCRRSEKKYCSSTWEKVGQPEEGRRPQCFARKDNSEKGPLQIGLNSQSDRMFTFFSTQKCFSAIICQTIIVL